MNDIDQKALAATLTGPCLEHARAIYDAANDDAGRGIGRGVDWAECLKRATRITLEAYTSLYNGLDIIAAETALLKSHDDG